jgi:hypothetical protein
MKFTKTPTPNLGDKKEVVRFAFLPTKINDDTTVWLEKYIEIYEFKKVYKAYPLAVGMYGVWLAYDFEYVNEWTLMQKKLKS